MSRKELDQVLVGKVEIRRIIRRTRRIPASRRRPRVSQPLDTQRPHLSATLPHLLPHARVHLLHRARRRQLARVLVRVLGAPVALGPLPSPHADVGLGPEAPLLGGPPQEGRDGVLDAVDVQDGHLARRLAAVEGQGALVQGRADGRKGGDGGRRVRATGQQRREAAPVGLAAGVDARVVDCVRRRHHIDHVVDVGNVVHGRVLVWRALPDVFHAAPAWPGVISVVDALGVDGQERLARDGEGRV